MSTITRPPGECAAHPGSPAAWRCGKCARGACDGCAKRVGSPVSPLVVCPRCGCVLDALAVAEAPARRLLATLWTSDTLILSVAMATPLLVAAAMSAGRFGGAGAAAACFIFYNAALAGTLVEITSGVGLGATKLPALGELDASHIGATMSAGVLCWLVSLLPIGVYALATGDLSVTSPPAWACMALGKAWLPLGLAAVGATRNWAAAIWPGAWVAIIAASPPAFLRTWALSLACLGAWWVTDRAGTVVLGGIPVLGPTLTAVVAQLPLFAMAASLGVYLDGARARWS